MKPWLAALLCTLALFAPGRNACAETNVEVVATDPPGSVVTLGRNQNFYLHLRYHSDVPTHIWAEPYFQGQRARAGSNPSHVYPVGEGEALGWFFLFDPGMQVDEVRIRAGDGTTRGTHEIARHAVSITGGSEPATTTAAPWVTDLLAENERLDREERAAADAEPVSMGVITFFNGFMLTMYAFGLLGLGGPAWGLWRWRGIWRVVAAVPAAAVAWVILSLFIDTARDPTSHNLWPFEILLAGAGSMGWMLVALLLRKLLRARGS